MTSACTGYSASHDNDWVVYETPVLKPGDSIEQITQFTIDKHGNSQLDKDFWVQLVTLNGNVKSIFPNFDVNQNVPIVKTLIALISNMKSSESELYCCKLQLNSLNALLQSDKINNEAKQHVLHSIEKYLSYVDNTTPDLKAYLIYLNFAKAERLDLIQQAQVELLDEAKQVFSQKYSNEQDSQHLDKAAIALGSCFTSEPATEPTADTLTENVLNCFRPILFSVMSPGAIILKVSASLAKQLEVENKVDSKEKASQKTNQTSVRHTTATLLNALYEPCACDSVTEPRTYQTQSANSKSLTGKLPNAIALDTFHKKISSESVVIHCTLMPKHPISSEDLQTWASHTLNYLKASLHQAIALRACCFDFNKAIATTSQGDDNFVITSFSDLCLFRSLSIPNIQNETVLTSEDSPESLPNDLINMSESHQLLYHRQIITSASAMELISYLNEVSRMNEELSNIVTLGIKGMCCCRFSKTEQKYDDTTPTSSDSIEEMASKIWAIEGEQRIAKLDDEEDRNQYVETLIEHLNALPRKIQCHSAQSKRICYEAYKTQVKKLKLNSTELLQIVEQRNEKFSSPPSSLEQMEILAFLETFNSELQAVSNKEEYLSGCTIFVRFRVDRRLNKNFTLSEIFQNTLPRVIDQLTAIECETLTVVIFVRLGINESNLTQIIVERACSLIKCCNTLNALQNELEKFELLRQHANSDMTAEIQSAYIEQLLQLDSDDYEQLDINTFSRFSLTVKDIKHCSEAVKRGKCGLVIKLYDSQLGFFSDLQLIEFIQLSIVCKKVYCFGELFQCALNKNAITDSDLSGIVALVIAKTGDEANEFLDELNSSHEFINLCNDAQLNPLSIAIKKNNLCALGWFVRKRPQMLYRLNNQFRSEVHNACIVDNHKVLEIIANKAELVYSILVNQMDCTGCSALLLACKNQSIKCLKILLEGKVYINTDVRCGLDGKNALHFAIDTGSEAVIIELMKRCPQLIYEKCNVHLTPVGVALEAKKYQLATTCISLCDNFDFDRPVYNDLPFIAMLCNGESYQGCNENVVKQAISRADLSATYGAKQQTILHLATASGVCFDELTSKANKQQLEIRDADGVALIHVAASKGASHQFNYLTIVKEINPQTLDYQGNNALMYAVRAGHADFALDIAKKGSVIPFTKQQTPSSLLTAAITNDQSDVTKALLGKWCYQSCFTQLLGNPNFNILMIAAMHNAANVIDALSTDSIKVCFTQKHCNNDDGYDPLMMAAKRNNVKAAKAIIERLGTDENECHLKHCTLQGKYAIHIAVEHDSLEYLTFCIENKVQLNKKIETVYGRNLALMHAAQLDKPQAVKILLQDDINRENTNSEGLNAAHIATLHDSRAAVCEFELAMLNSFVTKAGSAYYGCACLHIAVKQNNSIMVEKLITKGVNKTDSKLQTGSLKYTPLVIGILQNSSEAVEVLLDHDVDLSHILEIPNVQQPERDAHKLLKVAYNNFNYMQIKFAVWSKFKEFNPPRTSHQS